jgi:uncharacterized protein YihD (DUF1040 family)
MHAQIPNLPEGGLRSDTMPKTTVIMDVIEFCHRYIAKPIQGNYHSFYDHYHLSFDKETGQQEFRDSMNELFARNGLAYELKDNGEVIRLGAPVIGPTLAKAQFDTGDADLDGLLEDACRKYFAPDPKVRKDGLDKLWDAWERLKNSWDADKKTSVRLMLDEIAKEARFRKELDDEAATLTCIGNEFMIRHTEPDKAPVDSKEQVDYFFHRMFAMIWLILKSTGG